MKLEDKRTEELEETIKKMYPGETNLIAALEKMHSLELSENMEDCEEHLETGKFVLRELGRLIARARKIKVVNTT